MTRPPRQASAWRLRDVGSAKFFRVEISIGRNQFEFIEWPRPQLAFDTLRSRFPQVQRFKQAIESDDVGQIIVEISRAESDPLVPKSLLDSCVPAEIAFRFQPEIVAENLVLTARWGKSGRDARVDGSVGFANEVTGRFPPGPNVAELIEMIEPASA